MNKLFSLLLAALCILSVVEAAPKKPKYFNLYEELQGSWATMKTTSSISTGAVIGESVQGMLNITKNVIPNELVVSEIDILTKEENRKPYQTIVAVSSNFTGLINRFEPGAEEEITNLMKLNFREFLVNEVYYTSGSLVQEGEKKFEVTILPGDLIKVEVDNPASDERVILMAKKIFIAPPKTFWQKYGGYLMIGFALVIQMYTTSMTQNAYK